MPLELSITIIIMFIVSLMYVLKDNTFLSQTRLVVFDQEVPSQGWNSQIFLG
jgi:hypothetical protein